MDITVNHHHYFHNAPDSGEDVKFDQILQKLNEIGVNMSVLSDAVDAVLANEADEDARNAAALEAKDQIIAELQSQLSDLGTQLTTAMSNDAADAQAIADAQETIRQQAAEIQEQIDRLEEAFPTVVTSTDQVVEVGNPGDGGPLTDPSPGDAAPVDASPVDNGGNV